MVAFIARRSKAELVSPARPTPRETLALSDVDSFPKVRFYSAVVEFFGRYPNQCRSPDDPAKVIKAALAEALVFYYPIAGRLRELPDGRLAVDCTEEGVVFVEAEAPISLEDLGLTRPYPCVDQFLCITGKITDIIGRPLAFIQVTRLRCGGFVIGAHICHAIADGTGMIQFIQAIADLARGETHPAVLPVWRREILTARNPPCVTHPEIYPAYELLENSSRSKTTDPMLSTPIRRMVGRYFLFGQREVDTLRSHLPEHLRKCATAFELLTSVMWRCRTMALGYDASERTRLAYLSDARGRWSKDLHIPQGYYGNAVYCPTVEVSVDELCGQPLGHVLELVRMAKFNVTEEHMKSMVDAMAMLRGKLSAVDRPSVYEVSDIRHLGEDKINFGWAKWLTGGVAVPMLTSFHMKSKKPDGEDVIAVSMLLPKPVMERFSKQMAFLLNQDTRKFTRSFL
ncbi:hypothetical protein ACP70R_009210 [Stipagrostis hirtigluma subsp. patula]